MPCCIVWLLSVDVGGQRRANLSFTDNPFKDFLFIKESWLSRGKPMPMTLTHIENLNSPSLWVKKKKNACICGCIVTCDRIVKGEVKGNIEKSMHRLGVVYKINRIGDQLAEITSPKIKGGKGLKKKNGAKFNSGFLNECRKCCWWCCACWDFDGCIFCMQSAILWK